MIGAPPKMNRIHPLSSDEFTIRITTIEQSASGFPSRAEPTAIVSVPGNLQAMSTSRQMQYASESQGTLWDLHLPEYFNGVLLSVLVGWDIVDSAGNVYRCIGETMVQGDSGFQTVPVQRRDR
jgi:hypothetical protein